MVLARFSILVVIGSAALVGCFNVTVPGNIGCDPSEPVCPQGSTCNVTTGRCQPSPPDGGPDAAARQPGCESWNPVHFEGCDLTGAQGDLVLSAGQWRFNTDSGELEDPGGSTTVYILGDADGAATWSLDSLAVNSGAALRAEGARPLIIAAWGNIVVDGAIDVSSDGVDHGAGSDYEACAAGAGSAGIDDSNGGSGAGGGAFHGAGGAGGAGEVVYGGLGGAALAQLPAIVRGGCPGGVGGEGDVGDGRAPAGSSGGAVQLTAVGSIAIAGTIHAGGSGGRRGAATDGGGAGGGSGGFIGLDASSVTLSATAILAANGGAGGSGVDTKDEPMYASPGVLGAGAAPGDDAGVGGPGGDGSSLNSIAGSKGLPITPAANQDGGGGGGGGAGFIAAYQTWTVAAGSVVSPPFTEP